MQNDQENKIQRYEKLTRDFQDALERYKSINTEQQKKIEKQDISQLQLLTTISNQEGTVENYKNNKAKFEIETKQIQLDINDLKEKIKYKKKKNKRKQSLSDMYFSI